LRTSPSPATPITIAFIDPGLVGMPPSLDAEL
jgi:hypothetical protein